jgi:hypothetical protein
MNPRSFFDITTCVCLFAFGISLAGDTSEFKFTPVGYGALEVGQIESGYWKDPQDAIVHIGHVWQQRAYSYFGFDALYKNNLDINIWGGGLIDYSSPQIQANPQTMQTWQFFFLKTANAQYSLLNSEQNGFQFQLGFFPYKYNPDVRNLGEYLFRASAYPLVVYSDFDFPEANILGLRVHYQYQSPEKLLAFQNDLLLHSELYSVPIQDWSLSDVFSAKLFDALTIGGGVSFCNLLSVYGGQYGPSWFDQYFNPDTSKSIVKQYYLLGNAAGDTELFNWKYTKLMGRLSFDPKKFLHSNLFGVNDLILYGEADIMGLKDYPKYFTDMNDRIFYSVGINFPGFKIFDVVNLELEYCHDTSDLSNILLYNQSVPDIEPFGPSDANRGSILPYQVLRDQVRWSAYVKKTILDGKIGFIAQCARDHKKVNFNYFQIQNMSLMETLPRGSDWWWAFKTEFNF